MLAPIRARSVSPSALLLVCGSLMAVGLVMVASTTVSLDRSLFSARWMDSMLGRQILFATASVAVMLLVRACAKPVLASASLRRRVTILFFGLVTALLLIALIPTFGHAEHGSRRWLRIPLGGMSFGFQPSELAKLSMIMTVALVLSNRRVVPSSFKRCFLPAVLAIGVCVALVGVEDFGTSMLLACVGGLMLWAGGCRLRHLGLMASVGSIGLLGLLTIAPYRLARITAHLDVWSDPQGAGYQPLQSLMTIASGGAFGMGIGGGIQKYGYLPESHTDFIFSVLCEEMGIFGGLLVITLFIAFVWLGLLTTLAARTRFERLLALGLTTMISLQAVMNLAVVTVLAPTTGISLPFISAGGSGMFTVSIAVGLLMAVIARANTPYSEDHAPLSVETAAVRSRPT